MMSRENLIRHVTVKFPGFWRRWAVYLFTSSSYLQSLQSLKRSLVMAETVKSSGCEGSPTIIPQTPRRRGACAAKQDLLSSFDPFSKATCTSRLNKENQSLEMSNTISLETGDSSPTKLTCWTMWIFHRYRNISYFLLYTL